MITSISFNRAYEALSELEGVDVGKCAIEGMDANENLYYLVIYTSMGKSYIATCGPIGDDIETSAELRSMKFNEKLLKKTISAWLNDYKKGIYEAKLVDKEEALGHFPSIADRMREIDNE